jgi:hypothetical protein
LEGITSVGLVVRAAADDPPEVLPEVLPDEAVCELVQPARAAAPQTRTISTRTVLAFIPDDDRWNYLWVAIHVRELSFRGVLLEK